MKLTFSRECRMLFFWYSKWNTWTRKKFLLASPSETAAYSLQYREKPKFVGCKIGDMHAWSNGSFFYIRAFLGACECMWKYRSISRKSSAQLEIKDTIHEVKYGCLLLLVEVFIEAMNGLVMTLDRGRQKIFYVLGCSIMWAILPIREWRCQDIDQVLLHKIICFSVYSAAVKC